MKYGNFYDLESLTLLNRHEGCACSIKECDVEKVNRLISRMREDRERVGLPTAGDIVTYITRGGDYYPQAHIERGDDREVHICLLPQTPFCHENEKCTGYNSQVMLVYSTDDTLAECMKGFMNSDYQETYALTPVTYRFLTPETDCLFQMGDYPERLSKWLARFTKHIADNF